MSSVHQHICGAERWTLECHFAGVQVGGVFHAAGIVTIVPLFDDWIHQLCKHLKHRVKSRKVIWTKLRSPN